MVYNIIRSNIVYIPTTISAVQGSVEEILRRDPWCGFYLRTIRIDVNSDILLIVLILPAILYNSDIVSLHDTSPLTL